MEKKGKIIIGAVIVVLVILIGGFLLLSNTEVTLEAGQSAVTLPSDFELNTTDASAKKGNITVSFISVKGSTPNDEKTLFEAIRDHGNSSGYENVSTKDINGYTVYDIAGNPSNLKNVSTNKTYSGAEVSWMEFPPEMFTSQFTTPVDHFRFITYVNGNDSYNLVISTNNPSDNLYTSEIENIINSIAPLNK